MVNPEFLEGHQVVLIGIKVSESRKLEHTAQQVANLPEIKSVAITSGRYDIMAQVIVDSNRGIIHFLSDSLSQIDGIVSTETFLYLKTYDCWV